MDMTTLGTFPAELMYSILSHTDPRDTIRWRTVSMGFCALTYDTLLWKAIYAKAPFPCPPPSRSIESVERALVKSAKLAESWTTQPMRNVSNTEIHINGETTLPPKLIDARWLITCELKRGCEPEGRLVLRDVTAGIEAHAPQILWGHEKLWLSSLDVFWMPSVDRQYSVYVLVNGHTKWNLLKFRLDDQSGELRHSAVIATPSSKRLHLSKLHGRPPFLYISTLPTPVVFDMRTGVFYGLPEPRVALGETPAKIDPLNYTRDINWVAFTDTHLIFFSSVHCSIGRYYVTLAQAFTIPPDGSAVRNGNYVLRLTHESILDVSLYGTNVEVLKSSVDPATGATHVRLLEYPSKNCRFRFTRYNFTLPEPSPLDVLPMTIETEHFYLPNYRTLAEKYDFVLHYGNVFDDGRARCFYGATTRFGGVPRMEDIHIMKYTIDTTQDRWVFDFGELLPMAWSRNMTRWDHYRATFDGMRGKLCFAACWDSADHKNILVADVE